MDSYGWVDRGRGCKDWSLSHSNIKRFRKWAKTGHRDWDWTAVTWERHEKPSKQDVPGAGNNLQHWMWQTGQVRWGWGSAWLKGVWGGTEAMSCPKNSCDYKTLPGFKGEQISFLFTEIKHLRPKRRKGLVSSQLYRFKSMICWL